MIKVYPTEIEGVDDDGRKIFTVSLRNLRSENCAGVANDLRAGFPSKHRVSR